MPFSTRTNDLSERLVNGASVNDVDAQASEISIVFIVGESRAEILSPALDQLRKMPRFRHVPIAVVHDPGLDVEASVAGHGASLVESASSLNQDRNEAACDWLERSGTRYGTIATLPRLRKLKSWSRQVLHEVETLRRLPLNGSTPLMVWTDHGTKLSVARYVDRTLSGGEVRRGSLLADFLGRLALCAARPWLDALDPREGDVEIVGFLSAAFSPEMSEPPWRYRLALTGPSGDVARSGPVPLTPRVGNRGTVQWEGLTTRLALDGVGTGHWRFVVELDTEVPELRLRRNLQPRIGALISARTVGMHAAADDAPGRTRTTTVRYLLHTVGDGTAAFLTTQRGSGLRARLQWAVMLLKKDAGFIARGPGDRRMRWLRLLRLLTRPFFAGREIWLIGERKDTAQDNGVHLFRHLRESSARHSAYYVIDRSSPQYGRVAPYGHVVAHSSWRHQLLLLHAVVLANAYSIGYLVPDTWDVKDYTRHIVWRVGALRVYLKHGVHLSPNAVKRGATGYDVCLTVMPGETEALRATSGYDRQLVQAGMPRYDALTPTPASRTILFMPTWRNYLVTTALKGAQDGEISYEGSAYQRFMSGLLESRRLHEMLEKHDYRLTFLPHYNMASRFEGATVAGDRIEIADADNVAFQDLIRGCDAFVTDYSSVHFDVAYLGTPIVYARFDEEDFESKHSSPTWFDYERDGFGPVVRTLDDTLDAVESLLERDCRPYPLYTARIDAAFPQRDQQNCARTVAAIEERIPTRPR
ncbi:CDP-glycerol glycerophosphotransferase family protein [Cellulosimicrobium arenosum]|uniref:CDP-glycerol glycerophosphotransferase family protein n=1 Tax=Cellulosimicrobium arenosum TaxID=2708133 RepID=A0A927PHC3_9MICO|nr:CDP-glycerol glycerophosphotransferase family protein [Cellulosimicrobium arenosum]MBD8080779.1 CDP-glycerol glycerophosphotransferase family protein [Cellulosimicrobium arenosum]